MKKILLFLSFLLIPAFVYAVGTTFNPLTGQFDGCIQIEEEDGTPSNVICGTVKVTNDSLADNGDGTYSLTTGAGGAYPAY